MLRLSLVLALIIALIAVVFALQNAISISVNFLFWNFQGSLALILLTTLALGVFVGLLVSVPSVLRRNRKISHQKKRIEELQNDLIHEHSAHSAPPPEQPI